MNEKLLFTKDEWDAAMPGVVNAMKSHLAAYRTPVFKDLGDHGEGCGSGSFLQLDKDRFILTNDHVAAIRQGGGRLTYQVLGDDNIYKIVGDHLGLPWPFDLAVLPVSEEMWTANRHGSRAIRVELIAIAHQPVEGELLTFTGFSGEATDFHFNHLHTEGTCYTAREVALPDDQRWNPRFHFGIDYRPDSAVEVSGNRRLPLPPGLSGSTVWDTGFVAAKMAEIGWSPEMARVTGVVWGWPSSHGFLVATRAEYIRSFLLDVPRVLVEAAGRTL